MASGIMINIAGTDAHGHLLISNTIDDVQVDYKDSSGGRLNSKGGSNSKPCEVDEHLPMVDRKA